MAKEPKPKGATAAQALLGKQTRRRETELFIRDLAKIAPLVKG